MTNLPDFASMTEDQIADWVRNNDTSQLMKGGDRPTEPIVVINAPPARKEPAQVMERVSFRLPRETIEWLGQAAGRDIEGKSGLVRRALEEYRERHHDNTAA